MSWAKPDCPRKIAPVALGNQRLLFALYTRVRLRTLAHEHPDDLAKA